MAHVVATAFASKVFPVPGGPYSSRPERHRPSDSSSGCSRGNWIVSRISFFTSWSPPTSCQDTEGICQERESPCQHFFLSPEQACAALAPVGYQTSAPCAVSCVWLHRESAPHYAAQTSLLPDPQQPRFPAPERCNGENKLHVSPGKLSRLQSSVAPHITSPQKYPTESIYQGCLQLCGERALLQTALGTQKGR